MNEDNQSRNSNDNHSHKIEVKKTIPFTIFGTLILSVFWATFNGLFSSHSHHSFI